MDEISATDVTDIVEVQDNVITEYTLAPEDVHLQRGKLEDLVVEDAKSSAELIESLFLNKSNVTAKNAVVLNSAAAIYVSGNVSTFEEGVAVALETIESGAAYTQLQRLKSKKVVEHAQ